MRTNSALAGVAAWIGLALSGQALAQADNTEPAAGDAPSEASELPAEAATEVDGVLRIMRESLIETWAAFVAHLPYLLFGIVVLLLTWAVSALYQRFNRRLTARSHMRESLKELIERLGVVAIWTAGAMLSAMVMFPGLTPAGALGGLGLLSVAVGFAFRDIFENFFAGMLILWRFPFERDDWIEVEGIVGRVEDVTVRMTRLRQVSDELVLIPNATIFKSPVEVLTDKPKRRLTVMTGVAYGEDAGAAIEVIEKAVQACSTVDDDHPLQVFAHGFGASSIDIEVTYWTDPTPLDHRRSRGEVVLAIKSALDAAGIEIPFPYRTHTFAEPVPVSIRQAAEG